MRIAAVEKMGYYPTPPNTLALLAALLRPASKGGSYRFYDPCCGQGEALAAVSEAVSSYGVKVESYGVELSPPRAEAAKSVLSTCLTADYEDVSLPQKAFSLLYLNPPYDTEATESGKIKRRLEYIFLQQTMKTLQTGGLLVYIVPLKILSYANIAKFLAGYFEKISLYTLPGDEYERFGQIVLFAYRKGSPYPQESVANGLMALAESEDVPPLSECEEVFYVPAATLPFDKFHIRKSSLDFEEVVAVYANAGYHSTRTWKDITAAPSDADFSPVVPLKVGHVGGLIASGQMGTVALGGVLAKGKCIKVVDYVDDQGNVVPETSEKITGERERFETRVFTLSESGEFVTIEKTEALQAFLNTHAPEIASVVSARYKPLYSEPTREEWSKLSRLLPGKALPGRKVSGLLTAQKHVAIAACRSVLANGWADIVGEMGTGKTSMSLATLELIPNAYPAIVLCPGHITTKWAREACEVIPGAKAQLIESLADLLAFVASYRPGQKAIAVISKERAKLGMGWRPATVLKRKRISYLDDALNLKVELGQVHTCPRCGEIVRDEEGLPVKTMPEKRLFCGGTRYKWKGDPLDKTKGKKEPTPCNEPLFEMGGIRRFPISKYIRAYLADFFKTFIADEFHQFKGKSTDQASAYHDLVMASRYTINLTGTLFGGKSTDLFWLRYRVDSAVRDDFEFHDEVRWASMYGRLERTLKSDEEEADGVYSGARRYITKTKELPGTSPAIFARLLPSCIFVKVSDLGWKLPSYDETVVHISMNDTQREQYDKLNEILMEYIKVKRGQATEYDRKVSQKLLGVWLQNCLGRVNSGFRSEMVMYSVNKGLKLPVPIGEPMPETGYEKSDTPPLVADYIAANKDAKVGKNDIIIDGGEYALSLAPVVDEFELLPKEEWLVDYAKHELKEGRKVLLYVRQTGTRDIQPRIAQILQDVGLRAVILPDSVEPKKREAWIKSQVAGIDVLITNPKKVETGLDLVEFATCIFYELDYSLFTLWQAMRRVWRLGQVRPVKVVFPVYENSMESAALALMGSKMQAALLLYGDNAASAITDEAGDMGADFTAELAARLLEGETLDSNGITGLLKASFDTEGVESSFNFEFEEEGEIVPQEALGQEPNLDTQKSFEDLAYEQALRTWGTFLNTACVKRATRQSGRSKEVQARTAGQLSFFDMPPAPAPKRTAVVKPQPSGMQMTLFG